jgi:hypothetical protein
LKALHHWQEQAVREVSAAALFSPPPLIRFASETEECSCGAQLVVQKTRQKTVLSLSGPFIAHETLARCPACGRLFTSEGLRRLVPRCCNAGYDLLVFIGRALFQRHRSVQEVRTELAARNVRLSASEVDYLGRKFITSLAIAHRQAAPRLRRHLNLAGGYILHLDATCDGDSPTLMTGLDSLSQFVLANAKLPSEHADHIIPFLRQLARDYGVPLACVHDMGTGIGRAVADVFPGIHDFICHFHFLRDIGKDYLEPAYARLRKCLRGHASSTRLHALVRDVQSLLDEQGARCTMGQAKAIATDAPLKDSLSPLASTYSLAIWALQGKNSGDGYGFPFDRPLLEFAKRLHELNQLMPELLELLAGDDAHREKQPIFKLLSEACFVAEDRDATDAVAELTRRCQVFDRLRAAMRIAPAGGGNGLNDEGTAKAMSSIRQGVNKFRRKLDEDPELAKDPLSKKMARQIDKYGKKLFADPIAIYTPTGPVTIYPQRTNNILEQFFRDLKRGYRRKTGNNSMRRALQAMLADTPLVKNLDNPDYMKIVLDGKADLEELFAELDATIPKASDGQNKKDGILPEVRPLLKLTNLPGRIIRSLRRCPELGKSN